MPGLLTRYVAVELLKTILLTTAVLVTVIAFGVTIKPLVRNLLGGADILRYVLMASVPMLQYALPFAAGFGATLVMHRLASDNEILAMSASGLSHFRILRPVLILGVVLLLVMIVLVNVVVPIFWTRMESMLARDVTRLLASSVERGEAFKLGDTLIYADDVVVEADPDTEGVETRLVLLGVAAVQVDWKGEAETEFTAEYATLDLYDIDGRSILKLVLGEATVFRASDETLVQMPAAEPRAVDLGNRLEPSPKMFTLPQMLEVRREPLQFWRVQDQVRRLRDLWSLDDLTRSVDSTLAESGRLELVDAGRGLVWKIEPEAVPRNSNRLGEAAVQVVADDRVLFGRANRIDWSVDLRGGVPVVDLEVATIVDDDPDAEIPPRRARALTLAGRESDRIDRIDDPTLLAWAEAGEDEFSRRGFAADATRQVQVVEREIERLRWDIDARIQQRFAQTLTGPLLLILGSLLAIRLRHATPLAVYVVAFLPAIADILLISGGEQTLRRGPSFSGHLLLWSGNALLAFLCAAVWWRVRRN